MARAEVHAQFADAGFGNDGLRALAAGEVVGYEGQTFRAGKGDEPGSVWMTAL